MIIENFPPMYSGHAKHLIRLARYLVPKGYDLTFLVKRVPKAPKCEIREGFKIIRRGWGRGGATRLSFLLSSLLYILLFGCKYDIFHVHIDPDIAIFARFLGRLYGKKVINESVLFGVDDPLAIRRRKTGFLRFLSFRLCNAYVSKSYPITRSFDMAGISIEKVYQIPQMVDPAEFEPVTENDRRKIREKINLPNDRYIIISIGMVYHRKGFDILVKAFNEAKQKYPTLFLLIVGPTDNLDDRGLFYSHLLKMIHSYNLCNDVFFTGEVPNTKQYLQASDLFVFPSRKEGLPSAVIEAMSTGLPCIVSGLDGISTHDIFTEADTGVVITTEDPFEYAKAILRFANDSNYSAKCGKKARDLSQKQFSPDFVVKQYLSLYNELIHE